MGSGSPRPVAGEGAVCAAPGSDVAGRSAVVAGLGAQATSGILGDGDSQPTCVQGTRGGQRRERVGCTVVGDTCGTSLIVCPFHFQDWKWQTI